MMSNLKQAVEKNKNLIINAYDYIWKHPETGYREVKTSKYLEDAFVKLGYDLIKAKDIPGFYTVLDTGRPGPEILVLGEMDALICPKHPEADPETGMVHCCGHSAQSAALLGIAAALKEPGILDDLSGRIRLCAIPAEELIEIEYRLDLKKRGIISYMGGKTEFLHRGYFDGVDMALMVHIGVEATSFIRQGTIGLVAKRATYKGVSAHAGGRPWAGCNALYAANLGLAAVNAIRETFKEEDLIRVHPIITKGGNAVSAIPDEVVVESYVRGKELDVIYETNKRVNRALCAGALALGAHLEITDVPGYAPLHNQEDMVKIAMDTWSELSEAPCERRGIGTGSTDFGDLSCIMPAVHPYVLGATGTSHGSDYYIKNPEKTCVTSATWQMMILHELLKDKASKALEIIENYQPKFASKEAYFASIDRLDSDGERIHYDADENAHVNLS